MSRLTHDPFFTPRHTPQRPAGERVEWILTEPQALNIVYEHWAGIYNAVRRPIKEYRKEGGHWKENSQGHS